MLGFRLALAASLLSFASAAPALAWSTDSTPRGGSVASQFADPDETVDNLANPAGGSGTALSVQSGGTGSAHTITKAPDPADAEPVNPSWPLWMQWHQQ